MHKGREGVTVLVGGIMGITISYALLKFRDKFDFEFCRYNFHTKL